MEPVAFPASLNYGYYKLHLFLLNVVFYKFDASLSFVNKSFLNSSRLPLLHGLKLILFVAVIPLQFLLFLFYHIFFVSSNVFDNTRILGRKQPFWMVKSLDYSHLCCLICVIYRLMPFGTLECWVVHYIARLCFN